MKQKRLIDIICFIINEKDQENLCNILNKEKIKFQIQTSAKGIDANQSEFFGFGIVDKSAIFAITEAHKTINILETVNKALELNKKGQGIAFSLPITSAQANLVEMFTKKEQN